MKEDILVICPNEEKMNLLNKYSSEKELTKRKFMTKNEFMKNYFFSYDERAYEYLMNKYHYHLDVCKIYLKNLYPINIGKDYKSSKLNFLKDLKKELLENHLLVENPSFKEYIKNKKIIVENYYDLEKFEEEALNYRVEVPNSTLSCQVVECSTLEEEVNDVCLNILKLLEEGVDIDKIYLANIQTDYYYTIDKLFNYYHIPINLDRKDSIYSTKVVSDYLKTGELDLENQDNLVITKKLVQVINSLTMLDNTLPCYKKILIDKLKSTMIPKKRLEKAVNIKDIYQSKIEEDEYVFVLGFNQDILPKLEKDISYINDSIKEEVPLYTTDYLNTRKKKVLISILSNINHLHISYKKSSPFSSYYPSSLINNLKLEVIKPLQDSYSKSNLYNKLRLGEKLDLFYKYGEEDNTLKRVYTHYEIPYNTYSNKYLGISNKSYLNSIKQPLTLSYTTLNEYSECSFKYYVKNILKLSSYEEEFSRFLGNLYHKILSLYVKSDFNLEEEYEKYLQTRELSFKEKVLLIKIKKDLEELLPSLKKQQLITGFDSSYEELKIEIPFTKKGISILFKGFIDKIMYYQQVEDTYFSIIDYKSGTLDTNIEPMKYGLHMQLPVYLYLVKYSNIFTKPIFTGIYYQNILFNYPTCTSENEYETTKKAKLKLQGYSTDDTLVLERFDTTYQKSDYIKSMSYTEEKGFGSFAKVMSKETVDSMVNYTKNYIEKTTDKILDGKFDINPKHYNGENISCKFCRFKDLCYMSDANLKYLKKVEDLSFLEE